MENDSVVALVGFGLFCPTPPSAILLNVEWLWNTIELFSG